jgi:hypothetical protein
VSCSLDELTPEKMYPTVDEAKELIAELCKLFYTQVGDMTIELPLC